MTTVGVVSCVYGTFEEFFPRWSASLDHLTRQPDEARVAYGPSGDWAHPQAELLDRAIRNVGTEWVWVLDIDDEALPDGLDGIDELDADVWQLGYVTSDGRRYAPPALTNEEYLALGRNPYSGASVFRVAAYVAAGGYPDVAFQDWALWRRLARNGARFVASDRAHYLYHRHPWTRSARELTPAARAANEAAMYEVAP